MTSLKEYIILLDIQDFSQALLHSAVLGNMDQVDYVLLNYLVTSRFPNNYTKNQKYVLRKKAKSFLVKDGLLYHKDKKRGVNLQVIYSCNDRLLWLFTCISMWQMGF